MLGAGHKHTKDSLFGINYDIPYEYHDSELNRSFENTSKQVKPEQFKCYVCELSFTSKNHLNNHMKTHTTGDKPIDQANFVKKDDLKQNAKPRQCVLYTCEVCGARFSFLKTKNKHVNKVHKQKR